MNKRLLTSLVAVFSAAASHGQIMFTFDGGSLSGTENYANVSISTISTDNSFNSFTSGTGWDSAAQVSGASTFFSGPTSQTVAGDAISFSILVDSGYVFTVTDISFDARSTSQAPQDIGFSLGGNFFDFSDSYSNNSTITTISQTSLSIGLSGTNNTFAIQGWNSSGSSALQLDNIVVTGYLNAIPEPSTYAAILGGLTLGVIYLRRRVVR